MLGFLAVLAAVVALGEAQGNMDPRVTITETVPPDGGKYVVKGFISEDVTLNCFVENLNDNLDVKWQVVTRDNPIPQLISADMDIQDNNKWSIEKPTSYSWRLRIKALQLADEGRYTCYVQQTIEARVSSNRTVLAYETPAIIESEMSSDLTVKESEMKELTCAASGRPTPTIMWRREGNAILPNGGVVQMGGRLVISEAKHTDRGNYVCRAVNEVGEIIRKIFVAVQFSPKLSGNRTVSQAVGYRRTIVCYVEANPQPSTDPGRLELYWTRGSRGVTPDDRIKYRTLVGAQGRLIFELIFSWVTEEDFGEYGCYARNPMDSSQLTFTLSKSNTPVPDKGGQISGARSVQSSVTAVMCSALSTALLYFSRRQGAHA